MAQNCVPALVVSNYGQCDKQNKSWHLKEVNFKIHAHGEVAARIDVAMFSMALMAVHKSTLEHVCPLTMMFPFGALIFTLPPSPETAGGFMVPSGVAPGPTAKDATAPSACFIDDNSLVTEDKAVCMLNIIGITPV
eukprot:m.454939 g.454939  ORF g.454939 m.454939 type:complete len:136 (-) comp21570_c0_seq42:1828-2235(-)